MPTKNAETGQLYCEIDGELKPMGEPIEISEILENMEKDIYLAALGKTKNISLVENASEEICKSINKSIANDIWEIFQKEISCNNWRKVHHLPMIRWKGKRK